MAKPTTFHDAKKWAMAAFAQTIADGHYTATSLERLHGAKMFHLAARRTGLATPVGARNRWYSDEPPTESEVKAIVGFAEEYQKPKQASDEDPSQLDRIEEKVDALAAAVRNLESFIHACWESGDEYETSEFHERMMGGEE
jgi:hypothetical protein